MAKVVSYVCGLEDSERETLVQLARLKIISYYADEKGVIVGRYGVNKSTLKKLLKKRSLEWK